MALFSILEMPYARQCPHLHLKQESIYWTLPCLDEGNDSLLQNSPKTNMYCTYHVPTAMTPLSRFCNSLRFSSALSLSWLYSSSHSSWAIGSSEYALVQCLCAAVKQESLVDHVFLWLKVGCHRVEAGIYVVSLFRHQVKIRGDLKAFLPHDRTQRC